ncbi:hypothetical protein AOQ84DRAFT_353579 [Glonium stellatum]|uniref:Uncharacterized protein n=1 Tax=Glonium stellatum TaxID=574774 RepID=A0A8E2F587_9PEZI|nr:hypothetical protein AOQ84DRAFT_353579 [Glonium stellatum]
MKAWTTERPEKNREVAEGQEGPNKQQTPNKQKARMTESPEWRRKSRISKALKSTSGPKINRKT